MDCIATSEVQRVVQRAEWAGVEADHLAIDGKPSHRGVGTGDAGSRDRDDQGDTRVADDVEDLEAFVDLEVRSGVLRM